MLEEHEGTCCLLGAMSTKFWLEARRRMSDSTLNWLPLRLIERFVGGLLLWSGSSGGHLLMTLMKSMPNIRLSSHLSPITKTTQ
jgi:hypothetical protein